MEDVYHPVYFKRSVRFNGLLRELSRSLNSTTALEIVTMMMHLENDYLSFTTMNFAELSTGKLSGGLTDEPSDRTTLTIIGNLNKASLLLIERKSLTELRLRCLKIPGKPSPN